MKGPLIKVMQRNQLVYMMYISKSGVITKRRIPKRQSVLLLSIMFLQIFQLPIKSEGSFNVWKSAGAFDYMY